jgi:hypothetical protein
MPEYHTQEIILQLPEFLADRSINVFPMSDGSTSFNLVVSRDELRPAEDLAQFSDRQIEVLRGRLPQFAVTGRERASHRGKSAQLDFTWVNEGRAYHQRQLLLLHEEGRVIILTATTTEGFAGHWGEVWSEITGTMQRRQVGHA